MDVSTLLTIAVALLVGALAALLLTLGYRELLRLSKNPTITPTEQLVLQALEKWALMAVVAGERTARGAIMDFDTELSSVDQVALATKIYALIPDSLTIGAITIPVGVIKSLVPLSTFVARAQDLFSEAHAFLLKNETYLTTAINTTPTAAIRAAIVAPVPPKSGNASTSFTNINDQSAVLPPKPDTANAPGG